MDVKVQHDDYVLTALHCAAANAHKDTVITLLENGGDAKAQGNEGWRALRYTAQEGPKDTVIALLDNGDEVEGIG